MRCVFCAVVVLAGCGEIVKTTDGGPDDASVVTDAPPCETLTAQCDGDVLRGCVAVGQPPVDVTCPLSCSATPEPHCTSLRPSFKLTAADMTPASGLMDVTLAPTTTFNTSDGSITNVRAAGTGVISGIDFYIRDGVGVFRFQTLTIMGSSTPAQRTPVSGANALALVSMTSITIDGAILDLQGPCTGAMPGPGGGMGGSGGSPDNMGGATNGVAAPAPHGGGGGASEAIDGDYCGGGGGGGNGTRGGAGGASLQFAGGQGGPSSTAMDFVGGGGGGGGGAFEHTVNHSTGGGGGGAVHLAANQRVRIANGGIQAGGCGGNGNTQSCPGGGGAGGMIVIEADDVEIASATLAANGGGGGGTQRGVHGQFGSMVAPGGPMSAAQGGGGAGGANNTAPGVPGTNGNPAGGGGGGGAGRIVIRTSDGLLTTGNATISPPTTAGTVPIE